MTNFTTFNNNNLETLRDELNELLAKYDSNLDIKVGNLRYSDNEVDVKLNIKIQGAVTQSSKQLDSFLKLYKLNKVSNDGKKTLVEYKSRNTKYPFIYETADGKRFKCGLEYVKGLFDGK